MKLWDYSDRKGNIQGIICPLFTLAWGAAGTAYYFLVHSHLAALADWIAANPIYGYFLGIYFGIMIVDVFYSFKVVEKIRTWAKDMNIVVRYEELKETIKARATALKQKHSFLLPFKTNRGLNKELEEISSEEHKK